VLFLHWDVGAIVVLYWAENLVVGLYTLLKMWVTGGTSAIGIMLFFCLHYGGFCAIHGIFVMELTQFAGELSSTLPVEPRQNSAGPYSHCYSAMAPLLCCCSSGNTNTATQRWMPS